MKQLAVSVIVSNIHIATVCFVNEFISMCTHAQIDHMKWCATVKCLQLMHTIITMALCCVLLYVVFITRSNHCYADVMPKRHGSI